VKGKGFLFCSVMSAFAVPSRNSLERFDEFRYSDVLWGLHNWT